MTTSGRVEFMDTVRRALDRKDPGEQSLTDIIQNGPAADDVELLGRIAGRDTTAHLALLEKLVEAAKLVNVGVIAAKDMASAAASISTIAAEKSAEWGDRKWVVAWDHPLVKSLALAARLKPLDIPIYFPDSQSATADRQAAFRKRAEGAFIGITSADYCVAETATLTMKTRPGQPRCVSLLPSIHIAVIRLEQMLANLKEYYTLLEWNSAERAEGLTHCMTLITGPSKTADIEATLVHGAHGPRELVILVLTG